MTLPALAMSHGRALVALVFFGLAWACTIPLTKLAVSTGHQPPGLIFWQLVVSVIILAVVVGITHRPVLLSATALRYYLAVALLGTILPNSFSYVAAAHLPAGVMAISIATVPMFSLLVALLIRAERFRAGRLLGVLLGAIAVCLLILPEQSLPVTAETLFVLVALVAPACYALEGNYVAHRAMTEIDPVVAVFGASVIGLLICAPVALFGGYWIPLHSTFEVAEKALVASSMIHALVYCGYLWLLGKTSAVFASQIAYVVTLGGVVASALFLGERYSGWVMAALGLMIAGLFMVQPRNTAE